MQEQIVRRRRRSGKHAPTAPPAVVRKRLLLLVSAVVLIVCVACWKQHDRRRQERLFEQTVGEIAPDSRRECHHLLTELGNSRGSVGTKGVLLDNIAHAYLSRGPDGLVKGVCGRTRRKVVAYAITITKDNSHLDGAIVLAFSINDVCSTSDYLCDLVAFLHDDVSLDAEATLRHLGFRIIRPGLPLELEDIEDEPTRNWVELGGCCGAAELMKMFAYTLTEYHRVVHLDMDVLLLRSLDPLLDEPESLLHTTDVNMGNKLSNIFPVQGGFLVVKPDRVVFDDIMQVLKSTRFTGKAGWGNTKIGLFWGGINVQGLLPYYYEHRAAPENTYRAVDRCVYNNMVDTVECRAIRIEDIRSVHFTNCQKPWACHYPHPKQPLCSQLTERWFDVREEAEKRYGLRPSKACSKGFHGPYTPMLL